MRTARLLTVVGGVSPGGVSRGGVSDQGGVCRVCVSRCVCVCDWGVYTPLDPEAHLPPPEQNGRQV